MLADFAVVNPPAPILAPSVASQSQSDVCRVNGSSGNPIDPIEILYRTFGLQNAGHTGGKPPTFVFQEERLVRWFERFFTRLSRGYCSFTLAVTLVVPAVSAAENLMPEAALARLIEGNARFAGGKLDYPHCDAARRKECAEGGQHPFATVLTCSDSRLAVENIFDQGIGDVFVVRVAGNVADTDEIATIEYGVGHLHTPLLVVLGHSRCGAVNAACAGGHLEGFLPFLIDNIRPAVEQVRTASPALKGDALVDACVQANVMQSLADVLRRSAEVRSLVASGKLQAVGAVYDLETGRVRWLGNHPAERAIIEACGGGSHTMAPAATHHDSPAPSRVAGATHEKDDHKGLGAADSPDATHAPAGNGAAPDTPAGHAHGHGQGGTDSGHAGARAAGAGAPTPPPPSDVLALLREGNARFTSDRPTHPRCDLAWVAQTAGGQHPNVTVLTCSDSRVPVELIFDQGVGDLFVVRVAGNVADLDEIASIEYATGHLHTPVLIVLGHSACGAVTAVATQAEVHGCIPELVDNIAPAVARARAFNPTLKGAALVDAAIRANVQQSILDVLTRSSVVRERVAAGKLLVVGGVYDVASGTIDWIDDPTRTSATAGTTPTPAPTKPDAGGH